MRFAVMSVLWVMVALLCVTSVFSATLTCLQVSDSSLEIAEFSSKTIELRCTASGGTVSNIQITANTDPGSGLSMSPQSIESSLSDQSSGTAKWVVTADVPNTYTVSYTILSDGTVSWSGPATTSVEVPSDAQLSVSYVDAPSEYVSGDELDIQITNIGGATATNVILTLNGGDEVEYPSTIPASASASYSWTSSSGYDAADTYVTRVYIGDVQQDSASTIVGGGSGGDVGGDTGGSSGGGGGGGAFPSFPSTNESAENVSAAPDEGVPLAAPPASITFDEILSGDLENVWLLEDSVLERFAFTAGNVVDQLTLTYDQSSSLPDVPEATFPVYQYFRVVRSGQTGLGAAELTFGVNGAWLTNKGALPGDVLLYALVDGAWVNLKTVHQGVSEDVHSYIASIDAAAETYAIGLFVPGEEAPDVTLEDVPEEQFSTDERKNTSGLVAFIVLIIVVVVVAIAIIALHERKKRGGGVTAPGEPSAGTPKE